MSNGTPKHGERQPGKLFVLSIALNGYAEQNLNLLISLFLLDIALTFQVSVGTASQIGIISGITSIFAGLLMGALSVRFSHKLLLLAGAAIITVGVLGCFLAPSFIFMQIFLPLDGAGSVIVLAMGGVLIARFLPLEKRARAIGWMVGSATLAYVIGAPIAGLIAGASSWRYVLLWFFLPISIVGIALAFTNIPSTPREQQGAFAKKAYLSGFKNVLINKSAAACLLCTMLFQVSQMWGLYAMTFYRTRFGVSLEYTSLILISIALFGSIGAIVGGRLVNSYGRKRLTYLSFGAASILMVIFVFMPYLWIVLPLDITSVFLRGVGITAGSNLGLEQVPQARGTYNSLAGMFGSLGAIIGIFTGGTVLNNFTSLTVNGPVLDPRGFQALVPILGVFGITSVTANYIFVKDPCRK